jgi:hypothetical protein
MIHTFLLETYNHNNLIDYYKIKKIFSIDIKKNNLKLKNAFNHKNLKDANIYINGINDLFLYLDENDEIKNLCINILQNKTSNINFIDYINLMILLDNFQI